MDKAAIVILNFNGRHYLEKFLPLVIRYSAAYPVYVADNLSSDESVDFLRENFPTVTIIQLEENFGFSGGYNQALSQVKAEYYILLNSDVEVTDGWISPVISLMDENAGIAACQPKLLEYRRRDHFEYAGGAGGWIDSYGYPFCRGRIFRTMEKDYGQYDDVCPVFWASGACLFVRAGVFHELGGFDQDYFAHMEEIDLCWRIQLTGRKVYFSAESVIYHVGGGTLKESDPFKNYLNFRNSFITLIKNERRNVLVYKVIIRLLLDGIAAMKFLVFNTFADFIAVIRADWHVLKNFRYHYNKRKKISRINEEPDGMFAGSIVFSYYLLRKKYFFNLKSIIPDRIISSS